MISRERECIFVKDTITIRRFENQDTGELTELINRSILHENRALTKTVSDINQFLDEPGEEIRENTFVAAEHNKIIGYNSLCFVKGDAFIKVYSYGTVDPLYRRQGIGSMLVKVSLQQLQQRAKKEGIKIIYNQMARIERAGQIPLAEKFGFSKHTDLLSMKLSLDRFEPKDLPKKAFVFHTPTEADAVEWANIYNDAFTWASDHTNLAPENVIYEFRSSEFSTDLYILCRDRKRVPLGFICGRIEEEGNGVISTLAVSRLSQGTGVGKVLLNQILERMQKMNIKEVRLTVDYQNPTAAIHLYRKTGFKENGRIIQYIYELAP